MFVCNQILLMSRSEKSFALQSMLIAFWHFLTQIDKLVAFLLIIGAGCPIILPRENESVLLGAAILGAVAAKRYSSLIEAMKAMNAAGLVCMTVAFYLLTYLYLVYITRDKEAKICQLILCFFSLIFVPGGKPGWRFLPIIN